MQGESGKSSGRYKTTPKFPQGKNSPNDSPNSPVNPNATPNNKFNKPSIR